jgi:hypothetical protein
VRISQIGSTIRYCQFWYGGAYGSVDAMLWVDAPSLEIRRCDFHQAYATAVYYSSSALSASLLLADCGFADCPTGILAYASASAGSQCRIEGNTFSGGNVGVDIGRVGTGVIVQHNEFSGLTAYGVRSSDASGMVAAQANWWGDASGPGGEGPGSGVPVSSHVDFSHWWTAPNQNAQGVWNVVALRRGDSMVVDVYYDLVGDSGSTYGVQMSASTTGGAPYTLSPPAGSLSGAVGSGVRPGNGLHIAWDAAYGGGGGYTNTMRVRVTADLEAGGQ